MRELFKAPEPFIETLLEDLVRRNISGVNVDFEPTAAAAPQDAALYADFLSLLKNRLSSKGKIVTVAAGTWSSVWNFTLLAQALAPTTESSNIAGALMTMNTYTYSNPIFQKQLQLSLAAFTPSNSSLGDLVVGLETWPDKFTEQELDFHFNMLALYKVCSVAIWDMPIPYPMLRRLENLTKRCF